MYHGYPAKKASALLHFSNDLPYRLMACHGDATGTHKK